MASIAAHDDTRNKKAASSTPLYSRVAYLILIIFIDIAVGWIISRLVVLGYYPLAIVIFIIAVFVNGVLIVKKAYPLRWMVIGLALMTLFTIYPIFFTFWVSTTNYGEGHLITKAQAISQLMKEKFVPEEGTSFSWTAFKSPDGDYALWLMDSNGSGFLAKQDEPFTQPQPGEDGVGEFDDKGIPTNIQGYQRLSVIAASADRNLPEIQFGEEGTAVQVRSPSEAAILLPRFIYDPDLEAMIDQETGVVYTNLRGTFTSSAGRQLRPGFVESVQGENFRRFFINPALRGPLVRIITWNFAFAILSLLLNFSLGLLIAILFNDPDFPFKKLIRSLLIIPYTFPALLTILVWRGMLNPVLGIVNTTMQSMFGWAPAWFTNQWWAKVAILLINLWLSYPYFMLISSGSLQSISDDYYDAAKVDGANAWQQFWKITLPLLLVTVGPLLIASFVFNFNNFNLIYIFNAGNPPMAGTPTPAGHTDILISYVYNLAFSGRRGVDYGFAAAITIIIFIIVGVITLIQFRYTRMWEEVGENV